MEYFKACLKIDILNRDSRDYIRIEIFFDEWFLDQLLRPEILRASAFSI
jgi:hypothetical protein